MGGGRGVQCNIFAHDKYASLGPHTVLCIYIYIYVYTVYYARVPPTYTCGACISATRADSDTTERTRSLGLRGRRSIRTRITRARPSEETRARGKTDRVSGVTADRRRRRPPPGEHPRTAGSYDDGVASVRACQGTRTAE